MKLHREGKKIIMLSGILLFLLITISSIVHIPGFLKLIIPAPFIVLFFLILWFFRVPNRKINNKPNTILAPADGKIVVIENSTETEYLKDKRIQISIFMSPLDVHANYYPVSGKIMYAKYHPGKYLVAWHPKSSLLNERSTIVIEDDKQRKILVRQIAGIMARRIISYAKENDHIKQGDEWGFIRFGSRIDIFLPENSDILCSLNDKVKGQQTIVAMLK